MYRETICKKLKKKGRAYYIVTDISRSHVYIISKLWITYRNSELLLLKFYFLKL